MYHPSVHELSITSTHSLPALALPSHLAVIADQDHALAVAANLVRLKTHVEGRFLPRHDVEKQGPNL